jgi:hypothetical protein
MKLQYIVTILLIFNVQNAFTASSPNTLSIVLEEGVTDLDKKLWEALSPHVVYPDTDISQNRGKRPNYADQESCAEPNKKKSLSKVKKIYSCNHIPESDCNYTTPHRSTMRDHIRARHTRELSHKCKICGFQFVLRNSAKKHLKDRHGLRGLKEHLEQIKSPKTETYLQNTERFK